MLALDIDPRAVAQAEASLAAAGLAGAVTVRRGPLGAIAGAEIAGRVMLANVPAGAQPALLGRVGGAPAAVVLSGIRPPEAPALGRRLGGPRPAPDGAWERGGFCCLRLVGA